MIENQSSLWSANEGSKKNSQLEKFCKCLEKKVFLKILKDSKIFGNGL